MSKIIHIKEGLDLYQDTASRKWLVKWTDLHEEGLDTSKATNPICTTSFTYNGRKIPVISIFRRKASEKLKQDGNPALYALKKENCYEFINKKNENEFLERFQDILQKLSNKKELSVLLPDKSFNRIPNILIPVPSTNKLNQYIVQQINKVFPNINVISRALTKLTYAQILEYITSDGGYEEFWFNLFEEGVPTHKIDDVINSIEGIFLKIDPTMDSLYKRHAITNNQLRKAITHTMEGNAAYYDDINGKDVLLVDDSITFGASLNESLEIIFSMYQPKSVIILTMFSSKYGKQ